MDVASEMNTKADAPAELWLSLTDYASKYRISVSTLRRRIKNGELEHRFDDGRYLILDRGIVLTSLAPEGETRTAAVAAPLATPVMTQATERQQERLDEPIFSSANRLLGELKRAYTNILQEKEEQLIQLKEEVSDLKTLVRVLEDDNDRMRRVLQNNRDS